MAKTDLLKEAIADARAVRETALANAKIALEEAFTPRLQSMLSAKLSEDEEMEEMDHSEMEEPAAAPAPEPEMEEDMAPEEEPAMDEAEDAVETNGDGMDTAAGAPVDEDLELEAILRELEEDMEEPADDKMDEAKDKEDMDEVSDSSKIGTGDNKMDQVSSSDQEDPGKGKLSEDEDKEKTDEDISLDEIISALQEDEGDEDKMDEAEDKEDKMDEAEDKESKKDLEEAYNVIRFLKSKINEVNLLNAKLLFSNKLFRNHSLNEGQKMKVIENFDRAQSLREVKLVFATLSESFNLNGGKVKRTIKESYASKPSRSTAPKKVISEGNTLAARWKKLANL